MSAGILTPLPDSYPTVTILNTASLSEAISLGKQVLLGIIIPASWTAANLTFQASVDGTTFFNVFSAGGVEREVVAAASRCVVLDPADFAGMRTIKIRSGTSAVPVAQGGDRVLTLIVRPLISPGT